MRRHRMLNWKNTLGRGSAIAALCGLAMGLSGQPASSATKKYSCSPVSRAMSTFLQHSEYQGGDKKIARMKYDYNPPDPTEPNTFSVTVTERRGFRLCPKVRLVRRSDGHAVYKNY